MSRDSVLSVYSDARAEYTKQLSVFLVPSYFQFYIELLEKAKHTMIQEPRRALWQFQNLLNEIHDWNMEKVNQEIQTIHTNSGCDYLEDLLTAVFIAHTKVLTAIRLSSNKNKVEINVPKVEHFLFKALCETSKLLWSSTYLFREGISGIEKQQNYRTIEGLLHEGILQAIRAMVPVKSILKDFVHHDSDETKDDSDEEEPKEAPLEPMPSAPLSATPLAAPMAVPMVAVETPLSATPLLAEAPLVAAEAPLVAVEEPSLPVPEPTPTIVLDDKPTVRFGLFDAVFDSEQPEESGMVDAAEEAEDEPPSSEDGPVLQIIEEDGIPLAEEDGLESLDPFSASEDIGAEDYEEL